LDVKAKRTNTLVPDFGEGVPGGNKKIPLLLTISAALTDD
jgi:hypothetical protein